MREEGEYWLYFAVFGCSCMFAAVKKPISA
jgi:hypothetical protein